MTSLRRPGAREILLLLALLSVVTTVLTWRPNPAGPRDSELETILAAVFLTWRVSRGGWLSRAILIAGSVLEYLASALSVARYWDLRVLSVLVICLVQVVLLASPPVIARVRRDRDPVPADVGGWPGIMAAVRRPPGSLLAGGVLLGMVVTLTYGASIDWIAPPGCKPASYGICGALGRGYPLPWLTATQNIPLIHARPLVKDCVQWTLVSGSVLYASWLWWRPRRRVSPS